MKAGITGRSSLSPTLAAEGVKTDAAAAAAAAAVASVAARAFSYATLASLYSKAHFFSTAFLDVAALE